MAPVRIAVLSHDRLLYEELLSIMGAEASLRVVGHGQEAALPPSLRAAQPDVLLVDSRMSNALGLCAALKRDDGPAVILFMATCDDDEWALEALEAGARGILAEDARAAEMVKALRLVHEGAHVTPFDVALERQEALPLLAVDLRAPFVGMDGRQRP